MPYENMMPYTPLSQPNSLTSLLERARLNREDYERGDIERINAGYSDPGDRIRAEMQAIGRHNQGRAFASSNPSWDAWFQSVNEGTGGKQGSGIIGGGRGARQQERAMALDMLEGEQKASTLSPYNVEGRARARGAKPSLSALKGISYLKE